MSIFRKMMARVCKPCQSGNHADCEGWNRCDCTDKSHPWN